MQPDPGFRDLSPEFWANVRLIGQSVGYTARSKRVAGETAGPGQIKVPTLEEISAAYRTLGFTTGRVANRRGLPTSMGRRLLDYFQFRAGVLNTTVEPLLMTASQAEAEYTRMCAGRTAPVPARMNKQSQEKKRPAYFSVMIQMLIEDGLGGLPCDYDPQVLTTITRDSAPFRTLVRRIDGAFPRPVDPIAVWEIKEYYHTTTFGSRVADGVYETLLDGLELLELDHALAQLAGEEARPARIQHLLMIDAHHTWWGLGRSYLCRIIDMLHMGYVGEVLFGREIFTRLPVVARGWADTYRTLPPKSPVTA